MTKSLYVIERYRVGVRLDRNNRHSVIQPLMTNIGWWTVRDATNVRRMPSSANLRYDQVMHCVYESSFLFYASNVFFRCTT
jgi:hypothetical protein